MTEPTISQALGRLASGLTFERLPPTVVDAVKLHILDLLGAALMGYRVGTANRMLSVFQSGGSATLWGNGRRVSERDAALFNSFLSHTCAIEDGSRYTGGHPASVVVPAAIAMAESTHASGRQLIVAAAAGYEVFLRIGRAMYPSIVRRGFQSTAVLGGVSAAAACAHILRLTPEQAGHAIALGAMGSVGFKVSLKSTGSQPLQVARGTESGVIAALLAQTGSEGAALMIEHGMFKGYADELDAKDVLSDLGTRFNIDETYIKQHGGCRGNHAPVDVVAHIIDVHEVALADVKCIDIRVDNVTFVEDIACPVDGLQAQQSIGFSVAAKLVFGDALPYRFSDDNVRLEAIQSVMSRIRVSPDAELDAGFPFRRASAAAVRLRDGRLFEDRLDLAKGEPECPLGIDAVRRKFLLLAEDQIGSSAAHRLCSMVETLETVSDVSDIVPYLVSA